MFCEKRGICILVKVLRYHVNSMEEIVGEESFRTFSVELFGLPKNAKEWILRLGKFHYI